MAKHGILILKRLKVLMSNWNTNTDAQLMLSRLPGPITLFFQKWLNKQCKSDSSFLNIPHMFRSLLRATLLRSLSILGLSSERWLKNPNNSFEKWLRRQFCHDTGMYYRTPGSKETRKHELYIKAIRPTSLNTNVQYNYK